jgi:hypothetical protein
VQGLQTALEHLRNFGLVRRNSYPEEEKRSSWEEFNPDFAIGMQYPAQQLTNKLQSNLLVRVNHDILTVRIRMSSPRANFSTEKFGFNVIKQGLLRLGVLKGVDQELAAGLILVTFVCNYMTYFLPLQSH